MIGMIDKIRTPKAKTKHQIFLHAKILYKCKFSAENARFENNFLRFLNLNPAKVFHANLLKYTEHRGKRLTFTFSSIPLGDTIHLKIISLIFSLFLGIAGALDPNK